MKFNDQQALSFVQGQAYRINQRVYEARYPDFDYGRLIFVNTEGPEWSPGVMTYMFKEKQQKLAQMGKAVFGIVDGTEEERAHKTIEACEDFFRKMGLKTRLGECGIHKEDIPALAEPIDRQGWKLGEHHNIDSKVA